VVAHPANRFFIGVLFEGSVDVHSMAWFGASLHACARAGPFCLGLLAHLGGDLPVLYEDGLTDQSPLHASSAAKAWAGT
jgi:hypothetical protein